MKININLSHKAYCAHIDACHEYYKPEQQKEFSELHLFLREPIYNQLSEKEKMRLFNRVSNLFGILTQ